MTISKSFEKRIQNSKINLERRREILIVLQRRFNGRNAFFPRLYFGKNMSYFVPTLDRYLKPKPILSKYFFLKIGHFNDSNT